ncbi:MAG: transcriptional repressor LexA [Pseudomonadota bacterium]|nr:transcriptional repressor LexA [Pseudomonadota bacterium]
MLTRKQLTLLQYIDRFIASADISPSYDEMKDALGLKSKSGIHRLITNLEERGYLRRLPYRARALEIIKLPKNSQQNPRPEGGFQPNIIDGGLSRLEGTKARRKNAQVNQNLTIPLYGKIAAGLPIEAVRNQTETVTVPAGLLGNGTYYALTVEGDSMVDAGIFDGDLAVIEATDLTENGEIVVALVDNDEVTLKRIRRKGESIALEPANDAYETRIFGPDQISIQGRLIALIRQY